MQSCFCAVKEAAVESHLAEGDWTMQQQEEKGVWEWDVMGSYDLSAVSMASFMHTPPFIRWIFSRQQHASEWASEQVSEWGERVGEIFFFKENEEEDLCHISWALYFLHDG